MSTISPAQVVIKRVDRVMGPDMVPPISCDSPTDTADNSIRTNPARTRRSAWTMTSITWTMITDGMITHAKRPDIETTFEKAIQLAVRSRRRDHTVRGSCCDGIMRASRDAPSLAQSVAGSRPVVGKHSEWARIRRPRCWLGPLLPEEPTCYCQPSRHHRAG